MRLVRATIARAYALSLRAFPRRHRVDYRAEMVESFDRALSAQWRDRGRWRALRFGAIACLDVVGAGIGERRRQRRRARKLTLIDLLGNLGRDLKLALRSLRQARTFTVVCAVSLGLGLGVVLAISMFLRMLTATPPGVDADGLVELVITPQGPLRAKVGSWAIETWSYPDFQDVRDADVGMQVVGWLVDDGVLSSTTVAPQTASAMFVSEGYFETVGVMPQQGRALDPVGADRSSAQPVLVVSHRLWQSRFDSDPGLVGSVLTFNRVEHVVVGVAPEGFRGHFNRRAATPVDLWVPLRGHPLLADEAGVRHERGVDLVRVFARLSPDTTLAEADASVASLMSGLAQQFPATNEYRAGSVQVYTSTGVNQLLEMGIVSVMFFGLSGMVLIVVCLNVAGMVLVRSATREQELAVRQALGASRGRLLGCLMSEAVVLALAGGILGLAVVYGGTAALAWWLEGPLPDELRLNAARVAEGLALALATTVIFGLLPSVRFSRSGMFRAIKDDAGAGSWRVGRVHRLAAALQAGIALPFLVLGGLLLDSARVTATADLGFASEGLYASALSLSAAGYSDEDRPFFIREAQEKLRQAAGVTSVTVADGLPLDYQPRRTRVSREGDPVLVRAQTTRVGLGHLGTLGIPLLRGRDISDQDHAGSELVAVLSESLAMRLFPGEQALGQRIESDLQGDRARSLTVVGVAADVATYQMQTARPQIFIPLAQHPAARIFLIARASADELSMRTAFEEVIADLDPEFSRPTVVTGARLVRDNIGDLIQQSTLAGIVAVVALALSALGIYGVVAFMVASRTREMGVRIALGASRRHVVVAVLVDTCKLALPGLLLGLLGARVAVRQTNLVWHHLGAVEPVAYALAIGAALAVALAASLPSANRAAAVAPIEAIRAD